ncbi:MAG: glyceraldehyde 3-phosphate dehydrogenase NAD-binding domain-containing protein [Candidatus Eisenbacteria bacterium]
MSIRIGIMGFGRIGRNVFRLARKRSGMEIRAIVDLADPDALAYLLRFDTVVGRFEDPFTLEGGVMHFDGGKTAVPMVTAKAPVDVDWSGLGVDLVVDATHRYRGRGELQGHLDRGAKRVLLASPPSDEVDLLVVRGVNDSALSANHRIVSNASPTANCLVPVLKVLHDSFGVERGFMTAVHAYTNEQRLADVPGSDLRRSRAAAENIIPANTWAPLGLAKVFPALAGKIDGITMNVPVANGSNLDLTTELKREVTAEEVNAAFKTAAQGAMKGLIEYQDQPIVSSDVIENPHSAVFDSLSTQLVGGTLLKTVSWYDNGWGYANRLVELIERMAAQDGGR